VQYGQNRCASAQRGAAAANIRKLQVKQGVSQENLAVDAQIDCTYVSCLERGLENPTVAVLGKLADALGAQIVDLFMPPTPGEKLPKALPGGRKRLRRRSRFSHFEVSGLDSGARGWG
jgi:transcriptional regulator with XRE-family HTH domain